MATEEMSLIREKAVELHDNAAKKFDRQYEKMKADYAATAFTYGRKKVDPILDEILAQAKPNSRLLDIGCGTGEQLKKARMAGLNVTGLEPAPQMRQIAQASNPGVEITDGSIMKLPFGNESFDVITAIEVLRYFHPEDVKTAYAEMLRVLKPGGKIFVTLVNRYALDGFLVYFWLKKMYSKIFKGKRIEHCDFVTPAEVTRDLAAPGINITTYGRMFGPVRFLYKFGGLGPTLAKLVEPFDDWISSFSWTKPFAGHLVVVIQKNSNK